MIGTITAFKIFLSGNESGLETNLIRHVIFHSPIPGKPEMNFKSTSGVIRTACFAFIAVIGISLFADSAQAQSCRYDRGYGSYSSPGLSIGFSSNSYNRYGSGFSIGYSTYRPTYRPQRSYHDTSHYDYYPNRVIRHQNHYDYIPGHYQRHNTGHWHR
jgi:hypothetical protein